MSMCFPECRSKRNRTFLASRGTNERPSIRLLARGIDRRVGEGNGIEESPEDVRLLDQSKDAELLHLARARVREDEIDRLSRVFFGPRDASAEIRERIGVDPRVV